MFTRIFRTGLLCLFLAGLYACEEEGPMERAGENIDDLARDIEENVEEAGEELEDACEDLSESMRARNPNC